MIDVAQFSDNGSASARARPTKNTLDRTAAMQHAREFEAVFLADAFKIMYDGVAVDPLNGDGNANQSWRELLIDEQAKAIEARGGIGLAEPIARQLLAIQEASNG